MSISEASCSFWAIAFSASASAILACAARRDWAMTLSSWIRSGGTRTSVISTDETSTPNDVAAVSMMLCSRSATFSRSLSSSLSSRLPTVSLSALLAAWKTASL